MKLLLLFFLSALMMPATSIAIQDSRNYTVRHYTTENGLPQNSVKAVAQDHDGYLWLATNQGLARFDGQSFTTFNMDNIGIRSNFFVSFAADADGCNNRLYALTDREHVCISNGHATPVENQLHSRFRNLFTTEAEDAKRPDSDLPSTFYSLGLPDRFANQWQVSNYLFLFPGTKGTFFAWRKGGTIEYYRNWKKQKTVATKTQSPFGIFRLGHNLYHDDQRGNIELLATGTETLEKPGKIRLTPTRQGGNIPQLAKPYVVYSHDLSGQTFIYQNQTLYLLSQSAPGDIQSSVLLEDFDLKKNSVVSILFDTKNNRLFLGSITRGLFILDFDKFETLTVDSDEPEVNNFYSHVAFSDSTVLTPSFHVLGKTATGQTVSYRLQQLIESVPAHRINVLIAHNGDIWCRKTSRLYQFDGQSKRLKGEWDAGERIAPIFEDSAGRIWLGTKSRGLQYLDPREKGTVLHIFSRSINGVSNFLEEDSDILWVAGLNGIFKVSRSGKTYARVSGTENFWVNSMQMPRKEELWFTTASNGVFLLKNGRLTRMPFDKNKILAEAQCMTSDSNGFFWVSTNKGLLRVLRQDWLDYRVHKDSTRLYYHHYSKRGSGLRIDEFNGSCQPCAVRLNNGYVSLPSMDGLVFFRPEQMPLDLPESKIFIDRVQADSKDVAVSNSEIELANVSDLQVYISSPYLGNRENQHLYYTVLSDRKPYATEIWHPIEDEQQPIHLNNLESGTYTLKIRKNAGFGANSQHLTTLTIVIPYAWYETWPFKVLVALLVLTAIFHYYKNRLKKVTRLNRVLESRVSERTRDLQDTLSVLKTSEQELIRQTRLQMHLIASISHDIRSPLRAIEFTSGKIAGLVKNGDLALIETVGLSVNESSKKILTLLENMLSYIKSQVSDGSVVYETFGLHELVEEVHLIFKQSISIQRNHFENNVPNELVIRSNRQLLKIILHNLIDNANKFTSEGLVAVNMTSDGKLVISDTGPGLPEHIARWFEENDESHLQSSDHDGGLHGIGLIIIKELAEILKIELQVVSGQGTKFLITFSERLG